MIFERASLDFFIFILMNFIFYDAILSTFLHNNWINTHHVRKTEAGSSEGRIKSSSMKVGK